MYIYIYILNIYYVSCMYIYIYILYLLCIYKMSSENGVDGWQISIFFHIYVTDSYKTNGK